MATITVTCRSCRELRELRQQLVPIAEIEHGSCVVAETERKGRDMDIFLSIVGGAVVAVLVSWSFSWRSSRELGKVATRLETQVERVQEQAVALHRQMGLMQLFQEKEAQRAGLPLRYAKKDEEGQPQAIEDARVVRASAAISVSDSPEASEAEDQTDPSNADNCHYRR